MEAFTATVYGGVFPVIICVGVKLVAHVSDTLSIISCWCGEFFGCALYFFVFIPTIQYAVSYPAWTTKGSLGGSSWSLVKSILCGYKYSVQLQHSSHWPLIMVAETVFRMLYTKSIFTWLITWEAFKMWNLYAAKYSPTPDFESVL